ncbi:hypothetical protein Tco_1348978 [Tanacetum coccineum]
MTYGPKQTYTSDSEPKTIDLDSCESNSSVESLESMPKHVIIEPKTSEYASCKSNLSAESPEFFPKSVCARNESVGKADNPRKNNKSPRDLVICTIPVKIKERLMIKTINLDSCESNSSVESLESMPKPVIIEAKTSEYASCKSNLSAESPEFFPKSVCARNESVRKADNPRKNNKSPRGNKRSWNGMMTQKLGENFEFNNKACYVCGRLSRLRYTCKNKRKVNDQKQVTLVWNNSRRVNHQNSGRFSHLSPKSNMVPQALLTKSGLVYVNSLKRLYRKKTPNYNRYLNRSVTRVHTARPKTEVNIVKASASWVWKPKQEVIDHVSKSHNALKTLTRYDYVEAYGQIKTVLA